MKNIILSFIAIIVALVVLASCGGNKPDADKASDGGNKLFGEISDVIENGDAAPSAVKKEERRARRYLPAPSDAEEGKCGDDAVWYIEGDRLYIEGKGAMWDYSLTDEAPWVSRGSEIKRITVGDGISVIGSFAFANLKNLQRANIAGDVVFIGANAFFNSSIIEVDIPRNSDLYEIERYAFSGCSKLETFMLPNNTKYIGSNAFENCSSLWDLVFGDSLIDIGDYAFMGCSSLKYAAVPKNVESVGTWAFAKCSELEEITIAREIKRIPAGLCYECENLKLVRYTGSKDEWNKIDFGADNEALLGAQVTFN